MMDDPIAALTEDQRRAVLPAVDLFSALCKALKRDGTAATLMDRLEGMTRLQLIEVALVGVIYAAHAPEVHASEGQKT